MNQPTLFRWQGELRNQPRDLLSLALASGVPLAFCTPSPLSHSIKSIERRSERSGGGRFRRGRASSNSTVRHRFEYLHGLGKFPQHYSGEYRSRNGEKDVARKNS